MAPAMVQRTAVVDGDLAGNMLLAAPGRLADSIETWPILSYVDALSSRLLLSPPRLPKLASLQVLRQSFSAGAEQRLFGLASGSAWDAGDALLRYDQSVDPGEVQFQPGT